MADRLTPVAVIGLGRFGTALALELVRRGAEVLAVDRDPVVVQRMAGQIGQVVAADCTDREALEELGVPDFDRAVVAVGSDQHSSILTTALLDELGVEHIWAKALDRQHERILRRVGAHHVVLPEEEMGARLAHLVSGEVSDYLQVSRDWVLATATPPQDLVGVPLGESGLRRRHRVTVVSVKHAGAEEFTYADASTTLAYGDEILLAGRTADVDRYVRSR
ncbi:TrkA family potassium uptake protein [uncultured Pseudokineococcus sp.]|uniref:potassium channel family protein n=1 Tax=uncultured Pseudokineococcus sp. TaxID=1642928 RepID=UPI002624C111|nr:TrkA family potassium uptake protein [uncultured Pseudokineococcus sp.]